MMLTGTLINFAAILIGSAIGLAIKWLSGRFSAHLSPEASLTGERIRTIVMQGIALCVMYIGITGSFEGRNALIAILSMVFGAIIGELLDLDRRMRSLGDWVQKRTEQHMAADHGGPTISEGFVAASLIFCVGAMSIVGALENGLTGQISTLQAKSLLDGITAVVFASSLGMGVALSAVAVLVYQGSISLLASVISPFLGDVVIAEMTCVGSLLIVALALNILKVTEIKVMNLVPAIFLPILLCQLL